MTDTFSAWLNDHVFSPTELEAYQLCPYRFYAQAFLKLQPEVHREVELTPPEIGQTLHRVLEKLMSQGAKSFERASSLLEDELQTLLPTRPHLSKVLLEFQKKRMLRTLESFTEDLKEERSAASPLQPKYFEWSFGQRTPPLEIDDGHGGKIRVRGRIDRIDVDEERRQFLIVDYKTGSTKITGNQIKSGDALQLPLYVLAVQQLLLPGYEPIGGVYHQLSDMTKKDGLLHAERLPAFLDLHSRSSSIVPAAQWDATLENILTRVREIVDAIRSERFESHETACEPYCPYQDICRLRFLETAKPGATS